MDRGKIGPASRLEHQGNSDGNEEGREKECRGQATHDTPLRPVFASHPRACCLARVPGPPSRSTNPRQSHRRSKWPEIEGLSTTSGHRQPRKPEERDGRGRVVPRNNTVVRGGICFFRTSHSRIPRSRGQFLAFRTEGRSPVPRPRNRAQK